MKPNKIAILAFSLSLGTITTAHVAVSQIDRPECQRWVAMEKARVQRSEAVRRLRRAKWRLTHPQQVGQGKHHPGPHKHAMGPLESLRRYQIDCGELGVDAGQVGLLNPVEVPPVTTVTFPDFGPPLLDAATPAAVGEEIPPVETPGDEGTIAPFVPIAVPVVGVPVGPVTPPVMITETPEPRSWLLTLFGAPFLFAKRAR